MTNAEIKKAFETFKKEVVKELSSYGVSSGFTMSKRQIELRTATLIVNNIIPFDNEIKDATETDKKIQGYSSWSEESKEKTHKSYMEFIENCQKRKALYGSKENELMETKKAIEESAAFAKFQEKVGKTTLTTELQNNFAYYIRFHY